MKITYNSDDDSLRILIAETPIETVSSGGPDVTFDYDQHGQLVGMEITNTARHLVASDGLPPASPDPEDDAGLAKE